MWVFRSSAEGGSIAAVRQLSCCTYFDERSSFEPLLYRPTKANVCVSQETIILYLAQRREILSCIVAYRITG